MVTGQRMLAQLVSHSGGTPQVLSSTPRGSEFQAEGKKIPSLAPCAKALVVRRPRSAWGPLHGPGTVPRGYVSQCQGGARVRGFSRSGKPRLLLKLIPVGRSFPTRPSFFCANHELNSMSVLQVKWEPYIRVLYNSLMLAQIPKFQWNDVPATSISIKIYTTANLQFHEHICAKLYGFL